MSGPHAGAVWADPLHLFTQSPTARAADASAREAAAVARTREAQPSRQLREKKAMFMTRNGSGVGL